MHLSDLVPWVLGLIGTLLTGIVGMVWAKVERADATSAKNTALIIELDEDVKGIQSDIKRMPQQLDRLDERSRNQQEILSSQASSLARIEEYLLRKQQKES